MRVRSPLLPPSRLIGAGLLRCFTSPGLDALSSVFPFRGFEGPWIAYERHHPLDVSPSCRALFPMCLDFHWVPYGCLDGWVESPSHRDTETPRHSVTEIRRPNDTAYGVRQRTYANPHQQSHTPSPSTLLRTRSPTHGRRGWTRTIDLLIINQAL